MEFLQISLERSSKTSESNNQCNMISKLPQLMDYGIYNVSCSVAHNVALFCAYRNVSTAASTSLSGIKLKQMASNISQLTAYYACPNDWYTIGGSCLKLRRCDISCAKVCPTSTQLTPFVDSLLRAFCIDVNNNQNNIDRYLKVLEYFPLDATDISKQDAIFTTRRSLLVQLPKQPGCSGRVKQAFVMLQEPYVSHDSLTRLQTVFSTAVIRRSVSPDLRHFALCERVPQQCQDWYFQCSDGTCLDHALICDGTVHCIDGEDEADCPNVCTHQQFCFSSCSFDDGCRCQQDFFHCVRGGCIPLAKVCDGYSQCNDSSDEPPTCLYGEHIMIPNVFEPTRYETANQYINSRIDALNKVREGCLPGFSEEMKMMHVNFEMNVFTPICQTISKTTMRPENLPWHSGICQMTNGTHAEVYSLRYQCMYDYNTDCRPGFYEYCSNGFHLQNCEDAQCPGRYKCITSYCIPLKYVCNRDCNCPLCDDESFCKKLTCPGFVLGMKHNVLHCSDSFAGRQVTEPVGGGSKEYAAPSEFPIYIKKHKYAF